MDSKKRLFLFSFLLVQFFYHPCIAGNFTSKWRYSTPTNRITFSSPKSQDINGDQIEEIFLGCMVFESDSIYSEVICMDSETGNLIWKCNLDNKYLYGNTVFSKVNSDDIYDLFITGQSGGLYCINGLNGHLIWQFYNDTIKPESIKIFNFYNPKIIPDQNNDQIDDLLITNGGNQNIEPHEIGRQTGYLMIIDGSNGQIIGKDSFPDRKESYFSPILFDNGKKVIFGTGGETDSGSLWLCNLQDILNKKVYTNSIRLDGPYRKGFIQPCVLAQFTTDTIYDILSINLDGKIKLINGSTFNTIWQKDFDSAELYTEPSIISLNDDNIPDIYLKISEGEFDDQYPYKGFKGITINGANGDYTEMDTLGYYYCFNSALSYLKDSKCNLLEVHNKMENDTMSVLISELNTNNNNQVLKISRANCFNSTPILRDLNMDNFAELVSTINTLDSGILINCFTTNIHKDSILWGTYYGNENSSYFRNNNLITNVMHIFSIHEMKLFPNPSKDIITIELGKNIQNNTVQIFTAQGKLVWNRNNYFNKNIDVSMLSAGDYIIKVNDLNGNEFYFSKFTKL